MQDNLYAEMYRMEQTHWWFTGRRAIVSHLARRSLRQHDSTPSRLRVCELGCGTGGNLLPWQDDHDVLGVEPSEAAMRFAERRLGSQVIAGSLPDNIDVERESWDLVMMTDVLEHVENDRDSALTAMRLLRPNGILVATVPAYPWLYSPRDKQHHHFRRYSKRRFQGLFQHDGFTTELLGHYNCTLFPAAATVRVLSKWLPQRSEAGGDLRVPWKPLNGLLHGIFSAERWILPHLRMPFGLSLIAVVRRLDQPTSGARRQAA